MTPAELNHWAATEVMGWVLNSDGAIYGAIEWYEHEATGNKRISTDRWCPSADHNQCQQVIEKAIERGVQAVVIFAKLISMYKLSAEGILLATAEQKLRAVYEACKEMERK